MRLSSTLKNLVRNERGNVMMTFGLTSVIAIGAAGGAIDIGRTYQMKSRMQNAIDAAVVSGVAKYRESSDWGAAKIEALAVFQAMFTNAVTPTATNPNPTASLEQPVVTFTQSGNTISGVASATANTPFVNLLIGQNLTVSAASSGIPPSGKQLEVAVMVDLTGSMGWNAATSASSTPCGTITNPSSKLDYLKCAGEDLLNILLPASGSNDANVRVGIAPFADYVNAGEYASKVVDPVTYPETGGAYQPINNLAKTKQGAFTGTYSGPSSGGSGFGSVSGGTTTFSNSYCSTPTYGPTAAVMGTITATLKKNDSDEYWGKEVTVTSPKPSSVLHANNSTNSSTGRRGERIDKIKRNNGNWYWYEDSGTLDESDEFYVPVVTNPGSLTMKTKIKDGNARPVGVIIDNDGGWSSTPPAGVKKNNENGFWKVTSWNGTDWNYTWVAAASGGSREYFYLPLYDGVETGYTPPTSGGTYTGCESQTTTASSQLVTCVTERKNGTSLDYTAAAPGSGSYVGPYNAGSSSKYNYSTDGKCWVAGRELPSVIPLTNDRSSLMSFFSGATAGGATPGHLGTAWASYLLSPDWSSIWPSSSTPASYTSTTVIKSAILMTDGQYNLQFSTGGSSSNTSAKQALMLCKEMRDKGIKVYTIGFGFEENATPPTTNIEGLTETQRTTPMTGTNYTQIALDTLAKCASSNSSYYFPYDGEALRTVFKNIASSLAVDIQGGSARITN